MNSNNNLSKISFFLNKYMSHLIVTFIAICINIFIHYYYVYDNKFAHTLQLNYYQEKYSKLEYQNKIGILKNILIKDEFNHNLGMTKKEFESFIIYVIDNHLDEIKLFNEINFNLILKTFPYNKDILYRCFLLDVEKTYQALKTIENKYLYNFFITNYKSFININHNISHIIISNISDFDDLTDIDKIELFKYTKTDMYEQIFASLETQNIFIHKEFILNMIKQNINFQPSLFLQHFNDEELFKNVVKMLLSTNEQSIKYIFDNNEMLRNIFMDNFDSVLLNSKFSDRFLSTLSNNELNENDISLIKECGKKNSKECLVIEKNNFYNALYYIYLKKCGNNITNEEKYRIFKTNNGIEKYLCTVSNKNSNGQMIDEQSRYSCNSVDKNKNILERYENIKKVDSNEYKEVYLFHSNGFNFKHIIFINNKVDEYFENNNNGVLVKYYNSNDNKIVEYDKFGRFTKFTKAKVFIEESNFNYNLSITKNGDN